MRKVWKSLGILGLVGVVLVSCTDWPVWDDVFKRRPAEDRRGWTGGDGAISVSLGRPGRVLWLFGDSHMSSYDPANNQRSAQGTLWGTNLAVQSDANAGSPAAENTIFYARSGGQIVPIDDVPWDWTEYLPFFQTSTLYPPDPNDPEPPPPPPPNMVWPQGGACLDCDENGNGKLVLTFTELGECTGGPADPACVAAPGSVGFKIVDAHIVRIDDFHDDDPNAWDLGSVRSTGAVQADGTVVNWGNAFLPVTEGGQDWIYIYGVRRTPERDPVTPIGELMDAVLARAQVATIEDPSTWQFRTAQRYPTGCNETAARGSWASGPVDACALHQVADRVGVLFSVDEVARTSAGTRYVLAHTRTEDNYLHMRLSPSPLGFADVAETTSRVDLTSIDDTIAGGNYILGISNNCHPRHVGDVDLYDCLLTYHGQSHANLSYFEGDGSMSALLYGYIVPHGPFVAGAAPNGSYLGDIDYYVPKFGLAPVQNLRPFCEKEGVDCWDGVARQYAQRTIDYNHLVLRPTYPFDVRQARGTTLRAEISFGSGDPTLDVRFFPTDTPCACTDPAGPFARCDCEVPDDAESATVSVDGELWDRYSLRVVSQESDLGWTPWFDTDDGTVTGDYETLRQLVDVDGERICSRPTDVQCIRLSDGKDAADTGEVVSCTPDKGLVCKRDLNGGHCSDYAVRFYCGPTDWISTDSQNSSGDHEQITRLAGFGLGCPDPIHIECRARKDGEWLDYRATGQDVICNRDYGFRCINRDNGGPESCLNYQVRLYCGDSPPN